MRRFLLSVFVNSGLHGSLRRLRKHHAVILTYHRFHGRRENVATSAARGELSAEAFASQVQYLKNNANVLSLGQLLDCVTEGRIPEHAVVLSIDDGYRSVIE